MVEGFMKIKEPKLTNKILIPEILFIPCLAFDDFGYRLGYGGGYYDRYLAKLEKMNLVEGRIGDLNSRSIRFNSHKGSFLNLL